MTKVVFVSYYTKKPDYGPAARDLIASMDKMSHPKYGKMIHDVREVSSEGWRANVIKKPKFIRQMMEEHPEAEVVCWIDADAIFHKFPEKIYSNKQELAVCILPIPSKGKEELLSGLMGVRNTPKMRDVLDKWIKAMDKVPENYTKPEQQMLQDMLPDLDVKVCRLSMTYCRMTRETKFTARNKPVIQQRQWSRDFRPKINLHTRRKTIQKRRTKPKPAPLKAATPETTTSKPVVKRPDNLRERRKKIFARRSQKGKIQLKIKTKARVRREKTLAKKNGEIYPKPRSHRPSTNYAPAGGIGGANTKEILGRAKAAIRTIPHAMQLDKELPADSTVVIIGNAGSLTKMDLAPLKNVVTIASNRILKKNPLGFYPDYLVIGDREVYCQERNEGRLEKAIAHGTKLLLADSLFDPRDVLRSNARTPEEKKMRLAQPPPTFKAYRFVIGPKDKNWNYHGVEKGVVALPINFESFKKALCSCQNVSGSMFQAACILGAARIGVVGIEWKWPKDDGEGSHHYGNGRKVGAYPQDGALSKIIASFKQMKHFLREHEIKLMNLSPSKGTPFAKLFGMYNYDKFVKEFCHEKAVPVGDGASVSDKGSEQAPA